jgi:hypothetical protein
MRASSAVTQFGTSTSLSSTSTFVLASGAPAVSWILSLQCGARRSLQPRETWNRKPWVARATREVEHPSSRLLLARKEESVGHDQRFKDILHEFLQDFLKLFYPRVEERLDFEKVDHLDKEVFTDLHDGSRREADVVARIHTRDGNPEIILIHVEVQARTAPDVNERMFEYYALLRSRYKLPIFPIAVYLRGGKVGLVREEYRATLFGAEILRFCYESVRLSRLNAEEYLEEGGPVGAALAALMNRSTRTRRRSPEALRVSMLSKVVESELDEARQFLLVDLIETYFPLSDSQKERYQRLVSRKEYRKVQDVELTWAEKLEQKGREEGLLAGKREVLLRFLTAKFGPLPEWAKERIDVVDSMDELDGYLDRVLVASSLEDMELDA